MSLRSQRKATALCVAMWHPWDSVSAVLKSGILCRESIEPRRPAIHYTFYRWQPSHLVGPLNAPSNCFGPTTLLRQTDIFKPSMTICDILQESCSSRYALAQFDRSCFVKDWFQPTFGNARMLKAFLILKPIPEGKLESRTFRSLQYQKLGEDLCSRACGLVM